MFTHYYYSQTCSCRWQSLFFTFLSVMSVMFSLLSWLGQKNNGALEIVCVLLLLLFMTWLLSNCSGLTSCWLLWQSVVVFVYHFCFSVFYPCIVTNKYDDKYDDDDLLCIPQEWGASTSAGREPLASSLIAGECVTSSSSLCDKARQLTADETPPSTATQWSCARQSPSTLSLFKTNTFLLSQKCWS